MVTEAIEIRCESHPGRLLGRLLQSSSQRRVDPSSNLLEFTCRECARDLRKDGDPVTRVLHRYNLVGELVETEVVRE